MENNTIEQDDIYKVPNLEKGIAILEIISLHQLGMTLQEVKQELDLSQTTTYRILNTLVRLGYLILCGRRKAVYFIEENVDSRVSFFAGAKFI